MATLATLVVKLITDVTEFSTGLDKAAKKLTTSGKDMSALGDKLTRGVTAPIVAAGMAAVKFASDLDESRNKAAMVFGSMADDVKRMGATANQTLGMSENAALSYASTYGSILKNMGMTEQQTAGMSNKLVQLTADYASFHNLKPEETFEKIKSGLVGASIPLISLGKDLRVGAVEAYAMANGIGETGKALNTQELALARYGLLLSQSTDELGDFERTSGGMANTLRRLSATMEDTLAKFGEVILPLATDFLNALIPILQFFNELPTPVKQTSVQVLALAAALGPVLSIAGRGISAAGTIAGAFGAKGALAGAGAWIMGTLIPAIGGIGTAAGGAGAAIAGIAATVLPLVVAIGVLALVIKLFGKEAWGTVKMLGGIIDALVKITIARVQGLAPAVGKAIGDALRWVVGRAGDFYRAGQNLIAGLINGVVSFGSKLIEYIVRILQYSIDAVKNLLGIHSRSTVFADLGKNMMLGLETGVEQFSKRPIAATVNAVNGVKNTPVGVSAVRSGGVRSLSIGDIHIYGDLSASQRASLSDAIEQQVINRITREIGGVS